MKAFSNAHNIVLNQPNIVDNSQRNGPSGIQILLDHSIPEAAYDSSARDPAPSCFPGTRVQYIEDITHWALTNADAKPSPILWLKGPAGVGKSALAQSCVEKIKAKVAAAFFFSRNGRDDPKRFFTSIAYQISTKSSAYRKILEDKIHDDPTLVQKVMARQFEALIAQPLQELKQRGEEIPEMAVFIDGLDECSGSAAHCEIIEIIASSVRDRSTPFRWAFFSREEPHIHAKFSVHDISACCQQSTLPISRDIDGEIELYLREGFQHILHHHNLTNVTRWPSDDVIQTLVNASAGLFIYAATLLRFVGQADSRGPEDQLQAVLDVLANRKNRSPTSTHPFAELDMFYTLIIKSVPNNILPSVQLLLLTTTLLVAGGVGWCSMRLSNVLGLSEVGFRAVCNRLHAVLQTQDRQPDPYSDIDPAIDQAQYPDPKLNGYEKLYRQVTGLGGYITFYHKSFIEFITDPGRSNEFCIGTPTLANTMFRRCLDIHHRYVDSYIYSKQSKSLTLAPEVPNSAMSLSWPSKTEYLNSFLKSWIYRTMTFIPPQLVCAHDIEPQLLRELVNFDYCKMIHIVKLFRGDSGDFEKWESKSVDGRILQKVPKNVFRISARGIISSSLSFIRRKPPNLVQYVVGRDTKRMYVRWTGGVGAVQLTPSRTIDEW